MTTIRFTDAYRPRRFEDVIGQGSVVACLSGLIQRGQRGRDILLHGAVGSGKTSLAYMYGRALNCDTPIGMGSPCEGCGPCRGTVPLITGIYTYETARRGGGRDDIDQWVTSLYFSPKHTRYKILFFDEAQALTAQACDFLLDLIEKPQSIDNGVLFFFATTEVEILREALRSRLFDLLVRPLAPQEAFDLVTMIARRERIAYDDEAVRLLVGLRGGYPRNLLHGLERVHEDQTRLTVARVRAAFDVDQTEPLLAYFSALGDGDLEAQTRIVTDWREPCADKIRWTQALLLSLYYNDILHRSLAVDGLIDAIPIEDRSAILTRFCRRLGLAHCEELEVAWARMLAFWPVPLPEADEAAQMLRVALFHRLVNTDLAARPELSSPVADPVPAARIDGARAGFGPPRPGRTHAAEASEPAVGPYYLTAADVRQIINRASFLVQEHGVHFNATLTIRPDPAEAESGAVAAIRACHDELARRAAGWNDRRFASLLLLGRDEEGLYGRVVAHLPRPTTDRPEDDCVQLAHAWCRDRQRREVDRTSVTLRPFEPAGKKADAAWAFHWAEALALCRGLDEETEEWDPLEQRRRPLLALLGLKPDTALPVRTRPLVVPSEALTDDAIAAACPPGLAPLSAFDDCAWRWIRRGWELDEFEDRRDARATRAREIAGIRGRCGTDASAALAAIERWEQAQSADPHTRSRTWHPWWS